MKFRFYLIIATFSMLSSFPSSAMEECELCNESKKSVKERRVDPEDEGFERRMKICNGCDKDIKSYNKDKKQETIRGANDLRNFLENVKWINQPKVQTIPTLTPAVPPGVQLPTKQQK